MKRSPPPKRRTQMKRGKAPSPQSRRKKRKRQGRAITRLLVFERDGWRCLLAGRWTTGPCSGEPTTPHHLWKDGQGGPYEAHNLVTLCAGHNNWVERERPTAWALGLVVEYGETIVDAWDRMRARGVVDYGPDGRRP